VARSNPRWMVAFCCALVSNQTTAGPGELRHLRVMDVKLRKGEEMIHITKRVKNRYRRRWLPLEGDALWAMQKLVGRYQEMCREWGITQDPEHFVIYHRARREGEAPDPTRPAGGWRTAWDNLRAKVAQKYPHLATMRYYDLRHNCVTKMLEDPGISERTVEEMAGHKIDSRMKDRYSHIRMKPKRAAAQSLDGGFAPQPHEVIGTPTRRKPPVPEREHDEELYALAAALKTILKKA
jgi:integrase